MNINKILIAEKMEDTAIQKLRDGNLNVDYNINLGPQKLIEVIENYDALVVRSGVKVTRQVVEAGKNLKLIARAGVGVDNVDIQAASDHSILVINAPNGNTISACEFTCAHILNISRNMFQASKVLKDGVWNRKDFVGFEVCGKTLGIIGLGRIGREVGIRMKAFQMRIICYDPVTPPQVATSLGFEFVTLEEIWKQSDCITVHVPLLPETKDLVNKETLEKCKTGVMIVNCARGGVINENDLHEALISRKVYAAGLDVFEQEPPINEELLRNQYLNPTPHLGASTREAQTRVGTEIVEQIFKLNQGEKIEGAVNAKALNISFLK